MNDPLAVTNTQTSSADSVLAETYFDSTKRVALAELKHRLSIYAVIIENNRILMVRTNNDKWYFPGGGAKVGESLAVALKREAREELGVEVEVGELLYADDMIYYHEPADKAAHLIRLYYACRPLTREFHYQDAEERDDFLAIDWVALDNLNANDFLPSTLRALNGIKKRIKEQE